MNRNTEDEERRRRQRTASGHGLLIGVGFDADRRANLLA